MKLLTDIANIKTGAPDFRYDSGELINVVKMKNINHQLNIIDWDSVEPVFDGNKNLRELVNGEIIVVAKGERNTAVYIKEPSLKAVASNQFFILSLKEAFLSVIDPEYLAWFINVPGKIYLESNSTGAVISNLRKEVLGNLKITLLPLNEQKWILTVYKKLLHQKTAFEELFTDRMQLLSNHALNK